VGSEDGVAWVDLPAGCMAVEFQVWLTPWPISKLRTGPDSAIIEVLDLPVLERAVVLVAVFRDQLPFGSVDLAVPPELDVDRLRRQVHEGEASLMFWLVADDVCLIADTVVPVEP
jgi:hypothetical protein